MNVLPAEIMLLAQAAGNWLSEPFFGLDQDQRFVILIIAISGATVILSIAVGMITGLVNSLHRRRMEADIKQDLIDRGASAEEIAKIIECTAPKDGLDRWVASWGKK